MKPRQGPSDTYRIVQIILRRGNGPGLITEWFDGMRAWAEQNSATQDGAALATWLAIVKARPWYTADELAKLWPALRLTLGMTQRLESPPSANRLGNELEFHGLPCVRRSDGVKLKLDGRPYFIVEHVYRWKERPFNEAEFGVILMEAME